MPVPLPQGQATPAPAQQRRLAFTIFSPALSSLGRQLQRLSALAFPLVFYSPAFAQDRYEWPPTYPGGRAAYVELGPATDPDAIATLTFSNENVHQATETFTLTHDGLTVAVTLEWNVTATGDEAVSVTVPPGYRAEPERIQVPEAQMGVIQIFPDWQEAM